MTFVILFDTICDGYCPINDGDGNPITFETIEEAEMLTDNRFYDECFVGHISEIGHKTIYYGRDEKS